jgi:GTP-sensing pleiotropic transcriptional regulator CodY
MVNWDLKKLTKMLKQTRKKLDKKMEIDFMRHYRLESVNGNHLIIGSLNGTALGYCF